MRLDPAAYHREIADMNAVLWDEFYKTFGHVDLTPAGTDEYARRLNRTEDAGMAGFQAVFPEDAGIREYGRTHEAANDGFMSVFDTDWETPPGFWEECLAVERESVRGFMSVFGEGKA